jgi:hypothetical protein
MIRNSTDLVPLTILASDLLLLNVTIFQVILAIGETGFEPATARPPAGCATRLRHSP